MTERSAGIWVCTILFAIGGILSILGGTFILIGGGMFGMPGLEGTGLAIIEAVVTVLAAISIIIGVVDLVVAYGIWKMKRWARILGIILAIIGGIFGFPIGTVIAIIILYFLLIDKRTKNLFTQ